MRGPFLLAVSDPPDVLYFEGLGSQEVFSRTRASVASVCILLVSCGAKAEAVEAVEVRKKAL